MSEQANPQPRPAGRTRRSGAEPVRATHDAVLAEVASVGILPNRKKNREAT